MGLVEGVATVHAGAGDVHGECARRDGFSGHGEGGGGA